MLKLRMPNNLAQSRKERKAARVFVCNSVKLFRPGDLCGFARGIFESEIRSVREVT